MPNLDMDQKIAVISRHPCFASLNPDEVATLANLFTEKEVSKDTDIVKQDALVDAIYLIVHGKAEVKLTVSQDDIKQTNVVAVLSDGEAIGLSDIGFYSSSGKRSATVTAISDIDLLQLDLPRLDAFLKDHPHINASMQKNSEIMLRMQLIKKAAPFAKISMDNLRWLAEQVTSIQIEAQKNIFHKGDIGDNCYLIESGEIEIYMPEANDSEVSIAKLSKPMVFGEAALLLNLPRTASARAIQDAKLLVLSRDALEHITKAEGRTADTLENLVKLRSRPLRLPYIDIYENKTNTNETVITLKNNKTNSYFRLQEEGLFIWNMLDGKHTLRDITLAFNREYQIFDSAMVLDFIMDLDQEGFIEDLTNKEQEQKNQPLWMKAVSRMQKLLEINISFSNVDAWVTRTYDKFFRYFFNPVFLWLSVAIIAIAFILFVATFNQHIELFRKTSNSGWLIILAVIMINFSIVLHELAHAFMTKYYGKKVANFGVGWFWIGPIAFCDTSDMWLADKKQRVAVDFAGIFVDLVTGSIASLAILLVTNHFLIIFLWLIAFYKYLMAFVNLNPILEFDGYYILMDGMGKDNLRESALMWLIKEFRHISSKPKLLLEHKPEIIYWIACLLYISLNIVMNYYVINILLAGVLHTTHPALTYLLTLFAVGLSLIAVWGKIKKKLNMA
ncbi:MAG: PqqD family peptide modification chaperone [Gammaproteobacteria bacterium]|nr:PqqD family peptide modification chaperone [Gammaproteobacteria bacterium]